MHIFGAFIGETGNVCEMREGISTQICFDAETRGLKNKNYKKKKFREYGYRARDK